MTKTSKMIPAADPARKRAVIYARVSSKEQEKEGFSIPAQLKLLKEYAAAQGFAVAQEYVDVETAKQTGRTAFGEMVAYLKAHPSTRVMLVEKTDRLYRNLKDWVTVDELDVEVHFPKEGVVLSRESRSSEKFMHGIKVLMAKNYIDNLSEEARKGMQEKAEQGIRLTIAPWRRPAPYTAPTDSKAAGLYMICMMSKKHAENGGYDDAMMFDWRGRVAEATGANIFFVRDGELHTPVPDCFLDGITRRTVMGLARDRGVDVKEREIWPDELETFEQCFLTGTAAEVTPVGSIGPWNFEVGDLTRQLVKDYDDLVYGRLPNA